MNHVKTRTEYYEGFSGYEIPLKLTGKISEAEARSRNSYYRATYQSGGELGKVEKILNGEVFFVHEYEYDQSGEIRRSTVTNRNGDVTVSNH